MSKSCPKCQLISLPTAQLCDCGFSFDTGTVQASPLGARELPLAPALRWGAGVFGGVTLLLGWIGLILGAIAATVVYAMYQRQAPRAAGEGLQAYGIGILVVFLATTFLYLVGVLALGIFS